MAGKVNHPTPQPDQREDERSPHLPVVSLRRLDLSDADAIMTWASDERVMRVHPRGPCTTRAQALDLLTSFILPHTWYRAICVDGLPVGSIGVRPLPAEAPGDEPGRRASVGYGIAYEYWGKGIATAAVKMAAAAALEEFPRLERIEGVVELGNRGSQRVLEKAGFQKEGVLRKYATFNGESIDVVMYSFLRTDSLLHP